MSRLIPCFNCSLLANYLETVPEFLSLPAQLGQLHRRLGILPADTPVPISVLTRIWDMVRGLT